MAQKTVLEMTPEEELVYIEKWMGEDTQFIPNEVKKLLFKHYPEIYETDEYELDEDQTPECYDSRKSEGNKNDKK